MANPLEEIAAIGKEMNATQQAKADLFKPVSQRDFRLKQVPKTEWLFEKFLPKPALIAITGRPGSYKTYFTQWMAQRLSQGLPMLVQSVGGHFYGKAGAGRCVKTLYVEEEMDDGLLQERMMSMRNGDEDSIFWITESGFKFMDETLMKALIAFVVEKGIEVVFFDPFSSVAAMENENDNSEAQKLMKVILDGLVRSGPKVTVVFLHHPSKNSEGATSIRGAGEVLSKSYIQYVLEKEDDKGIVNVRCPKNRWEQQPDFRMRFELAKDGLYEWIYDGELPKEDNEKEEGKNIREAMLSVMANSEARNADDLITEAKKWLVVKKLRYALKDLVHTGALIQSGGMFIKK